MKQTMLPFYTPSICRYVPVPDLYWANTASKGPVQARYWQLMACLQGSYTKTYVLCPFHGKLFITDVWPRYKLDYASHHMKDIIRLE